MSRRDSGLCYSDTDRIKHYRASDDVAGYAGLDGDQRIIEVRYDAHQDSADRGDWTIDEIVTSGVHIERMDGGAVWMELAGLHVWFRAVRVEGHSRPRLLVTCYPNDCEPYVVKPGEGRLENLYAEHHDDGA